MKILLIIILILTSVNLQAKLSGQARIDSLTAELPNAEQDTNYVNLLQKLSFALYFTNPDRGIEYGLQGVELAKRIKWEKGETKCYNALGICYSMGKSNYPKALEYFHNALMINEELGDKNGMAISLEYFGLVYGSQSDYPKALEYYQKALLINEEIGNRKGMASNLGNMGIVYRNQSDYPQALEYYHKALKNYEEIGNKTGIASTLGNIGNIYLSQSDFQKALDYFHKAVKINKEIGRKRGIASNLGNIGISYSQQSNYPKAIEYFHRALKMHEEMGNKSGISSILTSLGVTYSEQSDFPKALEYYSKAMEINEEIGYKNGIAINLGNMGELYRLLSQDTILSKLTEPTVLVSLNKEINLNRGIKLFHQSIDIFEEIGELNERSTFLHHLAQSYKQKNNYKEAFKLLSKHIVIRDSVFNQEKAKDLGRLEGKYEAELAQKEIEIKEKEDAVILAQTLDR